MRRPAACDARGVPLGIVSEGANRHGSPLLGLTLDLDRGYDSVKCRALTAELGFTAEIARKGVPAPIQAGGRLPVERTHVWMNGYGTPRRCTERSGRVVDFSLYLAATLVTLRMLIWQARSRFRWDRRPTSRRLK